MPRWRVDILRKKAEHLGIVTAAKCTRGVDQGCITVSD
jgi:hypothetical protein